MMVFDVRKRSFPFKKSSKMKKSTSIDIYYSHWKQLLLVLGSFVFVIGFILVLQYPNSASSSSDNVIIWIGLVLFGGGGLLLLFNLLRDLINHTPFLTIYDDHISMYNSWKNTFLDVNFADVNSFELQALKPARGGKTMILCIHYKENVQKEKMEISGAIKKSLFRFNDRYTGAMESIPLSILTMKPKTIAEAVDARFKAYKKQTETL